MDKLVEQPKKQGRPNIMEAFGITPEQVQAAYVSCGGNTYKTAETLGIHRRTVVRYLGEFRLARKAESRAPRLSAAEKYLGAKAFKGKTIAELAELAGVSPACMKRALLRRARKLETELLALGDFRSPRRSVYDEKRRLIQSMFISSYELKVERQTLDVLLIGVTPAGRVVIRVSPVVYRSWFTPA